MKVFAQALGGDKVTLDLPEGSTIRNVKQELGLPTYTPKLNRNPAGDETRVKEYDMVELAPPVKGGQ